MAMLLHFTQTEQVFFFDDGVMTEVTGAVVTEQIECLTVRQNNETIRDDLLRHSHAKRKLTAKLAG